jgi:arginyl-tRNA synthetase
MGHTDIVDKLQHITFAKASSPSSHLGNAQLLSDILDQCENHMRKAVGATLDQFMGINPLVVQELSSKKGHSSGLDFSLLPSLEGETGANLQLCYGRLCSAIASIGAHPTPEEIPHIDYSPLWDAP